jgi:hypothetical protein
MQPGFHSWGKLHGLGIAEKVNRQLRLIDEQLAVFAVLKMVLQFLLDGRFQFAVNVIRKLADDAPAVQCTRSWRK